MQNTFFKSQERNTIQYDYKRKETFKQRNNRINDDICIQNLIQFTYNRLLTVSTGAKVSALPIGRTVFDKLRSFCLNFDRLN